MPYPEKTYLASEKARAKYKSVYVRRENRNCSLQKARKQQQQQQQQQQKKILIISSSNNNRNSNEGINYSNS